VIKIRLRRVGAKKQPSYRLVVADVRSPRDGRFIEIIGHYNPLTDPPTIQVDAEKAQAWLAKGAQMSETAEKLMKRAGVIEGGAPKAAAPEEAAPVAAEPEMKAEPAEKAEKPKRVAKAEKVEKVEKAETAETAEKAEKAEPAAE
jgi:small subunit ribosomal protein S16